MGNHPLNNLPTLRSDNSAIVILFCVCFSLFLSVGWTCLLRERIPKSLVIHHLLYSFSLSFTKLNLIANTNYIAVCDEWKLSEYIFWNKFYFLPVQIVVFTTTKNKANTWWQLQSQPSVFPRFGKYFWVQNVSSQHKKPEK